MFVKEPSEEACEEFVIGRVFRFLRALQKLDDALDSDLLVVHLLVEGIHPIFDVGVEVHDAHSRFVVGSGSEVHETRVELETLSPDVFEQIDVLLSEDLVTDYGRMHKYCGVSALPTNLQLTFVSKP